MGANFKPKLELVVLKFQLYFTSSINFSIIHDINTTTLSIVNSTALLIKKQVKLL